MKALPVLALAMASLLLAILAGLARIGWTTIPLSPGTAAMHGTLMVSGFFGTVVSFERAIALEKRWAWTAPIASGAGALGSAFLSPRLSALFIVSSAILVAASIAAWQKQRALHTFTLILGATAWLGASVLGFAGSAMVRLVPWWFAFLALTVAGERLELSRVLPPSRWARPAFQALLVLLAASLGTSLRAFGAALLALAVWLASNDVARRTIRTQGLSRFVAACLLSGYVWLAASGSIFAVARFIGPGSTAWDAAVHAFGLGFVFSMVIGHAPLIVPAVTGARVSFHRALYVPLVVLQAALALRVCGDGLGDFGLRRAAGLGNALAIALFVVTLLWRIAARAR